jgi:hypothetical protein
MCCFVKPTDGFSIAVNVVATTALTVFAGVTIVSLSRSAVASMGLYAFAGLVAGCVVVGLALSVYQLFMQALDGMAGAMIAQTIGRGR